MPLSTQRFTQHKVFVFIDSNVSNIHHLTNGIVSGAELFVLDENKDGIDQITETLKHHAQFKSEKIAALHLVSHGSPGCLSLGNIQLTCDTFQYYKDEFKHWQQALAEDAEILLYGCNVAQSTTLLQYLHQATGANVAASTTPIGNPKLGGNWNLDRQLGTIRSALAFPPAVQAAYAGIFADIVVNSAADSGAGSLREALEIAQTNDEDDTITFNLPPGSTITLTEQLDVNVPGGSSITIENPDPNQVTISGDDAVRVFAIGAAEDATFSISGVTIADGNPTDNLRSAGGLRFDGAGSLVVDNVIVEDNLGSGIQSRNLAVAVTITDSVIRNNAFHGISITTNNVRISGNTVTGNGSPTGDNGENPGGVGIRVASRGAETITEANILNNFIGTDSNNTPDLGNFEDGLFLDAVEGGLVRGNVIAGNGAGNENTNNRHGIRVNGTTGAQISGNTIANNGIDGISFLNGSTGNTIGTTDENQENQENQGNSIFGNGVDGISIINAEAGNTIAGNFIGLAPDGSVAGNGERGINLNNSVDHVIKNNDISGNGTQGIFLGNNANNNTVQSNLIGFPDDTPGAGNTEEGVLIQNSLDNTIGGTAAGEGNTIANNGGDGVAVGNPNSIGNLIQSNNIFANGVGVETAIGIDLQGNDGVTGNDEGDVDNGPNGLQNYPILRSAEPVGEDTLVVGTLNSTPNTPFTIALFSNAADAVDESGNGQGQNFLGFINVTTDGNGNASFIETVEGTGNLNRQLITATATDPNNNTSEFSVPAEIRSPRVSIAHIPLEGDPPVPGTPVNELAQLEGDEGLVEYVYTVTLDKPSGQEIILNYTTAGTGDAPATPVDDFNAADGSLTFNAITLADIPQLIADPTFLDDQLNQTITVSVIGERIAELDETFAVTLSTANDVMFVDEVNAATGTILNDDAAPIVDLNGTGEGINTTGTFTENSTVDLPIGENVTVSDDDDPNLVSATVTLTNPLNEGEEGLSIIGELPATLTADTTSGTEIVFTGDAPLADYATAITQVVYNNSSEGPDQTDRVVQVTVNDGINDSEPALNTISVTAVNDAPVNTVPEALTIDEDTTVTFTGATGISVVDVDAGDGEIEIDLSVTNGVLTLASVEGLTIIAGADSSNAVTFTGTLTNISAALDGLVYTPTLDFSGSDTLTLNTNDLGNTGPDGAQTASSTVPITVTAINDLPILDLDTTVTDSINFATGFVERRSGTGLTNGSNVSIFDPDNPTMQSATATLTNPAAGDVLEILGDLPGGIVADTSVAGVLTLTGEASQADYQQAIAQIAYNSNSNNPATETRIIEVTVNDGLDNSTPAAVTQVAIFPVNDPPQVDLDGTTDGTDFSTSFTEGGAAVAVANPDNTVVSDSDSTTVAGAILTLTNPFNPGAETLAVAGTLPDGIAVGDYNGATGELILTGSASLADYQTAIAQVTYNNSSASPDLTPRVVEVVVNDGINDSNIARSEITINPVNAAPIANVDSITTRLNTAITFNLTHNDFDPDGEIDPSTVDLNPVTDEVETTAVLFNEGEISVDELGNVTLVPREGFTGDITFSYRVSDRDGGISEETTVTVGVISELLGNQPPITANNSTPIIGNDAVNVAIPPLSGTDLDEGDSVTSFRLTSLPLNGELLVGGTAVTVGQTVSLDAASSLTYTPAPGFSGVDQFGYVAIDSLGAADPNPGTVAIPVNVGNQPPVTADLIAAPIAIGTATAPVPALSAVDGDGEVVSYEITRLPQKGTLLLGEQPLEVGSVLTPEEAQTLVFAPGADFTGDSTFQYTAIDNLGARDESPATVFLPPAVGNNLEPIAADVVAPVVSNSAASVVLPALQGSDIDGSIDTFTITTLPQKGALQFNNAGVVAGQAIPADQADSLVYVPDGDFSGSVSFQYTATDDQGAVSLFPATYFIPVTFSNLPPVPVNPAIDRFKNVDLATLLPPLTATDGDGEISGFTIEELPLSGELLLNGEAVALNQVISLEEASQLSFDPDVNFSGLTRFTFSATDNAGGTSLFDGVGSLFIIPNLLPQAEDTAGSSTPSTLSTIVPTPTVSDVDGTVESLSIVELPTAEEGRLSLNGITVTSLTQVENLTVSQFGTLLFVPNPSFGGNAVFSYVATDNNGQNSEPATLTIPVFVPPEAIDGIDELPETPPTVEPITIPDIPNDGSAVDITLTAINITEEVEFFTITQIPTLAQGQLFLDGVLVVSLEQVATLTVVQASLLTFVPAPSFFGQISLSYTATTVTGVTSSSAAINLVIPTVAEGFVPVTGNLPFEFITLTSVALSIQQSITTIIESITVNLVETTITATTIGEILVGAEISEEIVGSVGSDVLLGFGGTDNLLGEAGADTVDGGDADDYIDGGSGDDQLFGGSGRDTLRGGDGNDSLFGASSDILIPDLDPDDLLVGDGGDDFIVGNTGNDTLSGGTGNDSGFGGQGDDFLYGDDGNDELFGDAGNDQVSGGDGEDRLFGNTGNDTLSGGNGDDQLFGGKDQDLIFGDAGNDILFGDLGDDSLFGNEGNDQLNGGEGNDTLVGGAGNDRIDGNAGTDVLFGDTGSDTFVLAAETQGDIIADFTDGEDVLELPGEVTFADLTIVESDGTTLIQFNDQLLVTLENVTADLITEADFI